MGTPHADAAESDPRNADCRPEIASSTTPPSSTTRAIAPSEKALGKRREHHHDCASEIVRRPKKIHLNPTKSAALALLSSKDALFALPPTRASSAQPEASNTGPVSPLDAPTSILVPPAATVNPTQNAGDPSASAPNGRSLRVRTVRPSYLEIPPPALPPYGSFASASTSRLPSVEPEPETAVSLLKASGKLAKRLNKWAKDRKSPAIGEGTARGKEGAEFSANGQRARTVKDDKKRRRRAASESSLSSLSSSSEEEGIKRAKPTTKTKRSKAPAAVEREPTDRDSSPLSSICDSSSSSPLSSPEPESRAPLSFPDKPDDHPLNRAFGRRGKPRAPSPPPSLEVFRQHCADLNRYSWAEGLREITLGGEIVAPTFEVDEEVDEEAEGDARPQAKKKKPRWEWEPAPIIDRSVSPLLVVDSNGIAPNLGASLAQPPPSASTSTTFLSVPLASHALPRATSLLTNSSAPTTQAAPIVIARPKTYRQIARLDWSDFHQRNKCRFTTSGATDGVNPEGLAWEEWYGIEDEYVAPLNRLNAVDPSKAIKMSGRSKIVDLFVLDPKRLESLGGRGDERDFECVELEQSFNGGMEWNNAWRYKTLHEGQGRTWESRCHWAVRNPERKWITPESDDEKPSTTTDGAEAEARERVEAERLQRKRERKKAKREKARKEREGSGGDSELTPLEGEELSTDSDETDEEKVIATIDAATIAKRSSLIMQEAANAHAASGKAGVMVRCPLPSCPQRFYRSKASSSAATHHRHYHTDSINVKYSSGISAYIVRKSNGDFSCPAPDCGFATKSRGTMAVHGKPPKGNCRGPPASIPKPKRRGKKPKKQFFEPIPLVATPNGSSAGSVTSEQMQLDDASDDDDEDMSLDE
ncbi:hypothetical protein JCM3766R1_001715 [Sporobolomyces carnicolor]